MRNLYIILLIFFLITIGCTNKNIEKTVDANVIENILVQIESTNPFIDSCYIVNPNVNDFLFNENNAEIVENFFQETELKSKMFIKGNSFSDDMLVDFSKCKKSQFLFSFSTIEDNFVFVKLEIKTDEIDIGEEKVAQNIRNTQWELYLFEIGENQKISEIHHEIIHLN